VDAIQVPLLLWAYGHYGRGVTVSRTTRRTGTLALCLAAGFTTMLDQSTLNVTVPVLRSSLGAGPSQLQWIIAGYSLAFGLALVPGGRLGDAHGRKWLFVGGLVLFTGAGVMAGTAVHPGVLIVARLLQGVGAGAVNPQIFGIIQELFTGRERARALGAYAMVGGIAGIVGPLVGGTILGTTGPELGWRVVLLINLPFGLLTVPLAIRWLPSSRPAATVRRSLDLPGLALMAAVTSCVLLPFVLPDGQGPPRVVWLLAGPAALAAFVAWERGYARRGHTPILLPALTRSRGFVLGVLVAMFQFGSVLASSLALTLLLQDGFGYSPLHAALTTLPSAAGFAVASASSWRLVGRYGRISVVWALAGCVAGTGATIAVVAWAPAPWLGFLLTLTQLAMGVCGGLIISPNQALTLAHAPAGAAGLAGGFLQISQRISATISMAAVSGVVLVASGVTPRTATVHGLTICLGMLVLSTVFAALDAVPVPSARPAAAVPVSSAASR
jgi:MFS family permease